MKYNNKKVRWGLFLCFLLLIGGKSAIAQNYDLENREERNKAFSTFLIIGKIIDKETGTPLEFGTVTLYARQDSAILTGCISNANGEFSLETSHRDYFIKIEFIAYHPVIIPSPPPPNHGQLIDLGVITLEPDINIIGQVEVRAAKSSVAMSLDKRVFNVGKDLTSTGGTAEDVLRNVPGLSIDVDGSFNLRGSSGIRILLNGRASSLVNSNNLSGLRQIQASQIDRIEVITNPSARYEAEGMAGIINIILKKNNKKGLNGSAYLNTGSPANYGMEANLNYFKNKINAFLGIGGWYVVRPGTGSFRNQFYNSGSNGQTVYSNMDRTHERKNTPIYLKFGADYSFNSKNILLTSFAYRKSPGNNSAALIYTDALGNPKNIYLTTNRSEKEEEVTSNLNYSLIYKKLFSQKGHQLILDVQYENKLREENSEYDEIYRDGSNTMLEEDYQQFTNNNEGNRRLGFNLDYALPLKKDNLLETGWQSTHRNIFNDYQVTEQINGVTNTNTNFTNNFRYREFIHGMYINFGKKTGALSFQGGLRAEYSDVETLMLLTNEVNSRKYLNLFPSAFLSFDLSGNNAMQVSYSRRIQRPSFADLNPFFTLQDRRNIFRGNPNIEPELTDSYELGHIKYWEKGSLSTTAYFRKTNNVIKRLQRLDKNFPGRTITQAENLALKRNFGIEFTYSWHPVSWYQLNGDLNFFHSYSGGSFYYEGEEYIVGGQSFSMITKTSSRLTFWKKLNTQLTTSYSAPRVTTQGVNRAILAFDFAIGVDMLKDKGTITLNISDLFNSRRRRSFSEDDTFYSEDNFLWQRRAFLLSFHYRLNQQKDKNRIYTTPVNEDEDNF